MKIVVIDDSQTNLVILRGLVAKLMDANCFAFNDSERAIEHLMTNEADVIVVDYSMPKITGVELIKRMRASPRHSSTPIIMVTSSAEVAVRRRAIEVGATAFLTKPLKPADLIGGIMNAANTSAARAISA